MMTRMRNWLAVSLVGLTFIATPVCPAMAFDSAPTHHAGMTTERHHRSRVEVPTPACCLGAPTHPTEQGTSVETVSVVSPVVVSNSVDVLRTRAELTTQRRQIRIRDPEKKFDCRTKAKRE